MNILMMTNTYLPHTGGVARSVAWFCEEFRNLGHRILVVAPTFEGPNGRWSDKQEGVVRLPAIQKFNGSDFSVRLPIPGLVTHAVDEFKPDVVHAHHPFLLGDTALRVAAGRNLPMVFTHHTMYEQYTHYVPGDSPALRRFAIRLATEFANLCDHVVAPSESIAEVLKERGVHVPITAIPTGIHKQRFAFGDGLAARRRYGIPAEATVVGHVGRLAAEKNLEFMTHAVATWLRRHPQAHFLLVGKGPMEKRIADICASYDVSERMHHPPSQLDGQELADAYHAMDVFAFASQSETQGMVLAEAMTAGVPVVALDAPGAREVVQDEQNGRLLLEQNVDSFAAALEGVVEASAAQKQPMRAAALQTADRFSMPVCAARLLEVYETAIEASREKGAYDNEHWGWASIVRRIEEEWNIWAGVTHAVGDALFGSHSKPKNRSA